MSHTIDVDAPAWNGVADLEGLTARAVEAGLSAGGLDPNECHVALFFADDETLRELNKTWRGKDKATNVLSFPAPQGLPKDEGEPDHLGDIALAHGVIAQEAKEQDKTLPDHATHLIIHGVLHLLGHDHETDAEASEMEALEIDILKGLGISNPYERD